MLQMLFRLYPIICLARNSGGADCPCPVLLCFFINHEHYRQICNWEQYLYENGYRVVKVYLNVSRDEQKRRFLDRLEREDKHWKLSVDDMRERCLWKQYDEAFEDAINATATKESPWYVLPADDKWFTRYLMSEILLDVLMDVNPDYPPLDPAEAAKVPAILAELENGE